MPNFNNTNQNCFKSKLTHQYLKNSNITFKFNWEQCMLLMKKIVNVNNQTSLNNLNHSPILFKNIKTYKFGVFKFNK